MSPTPGIPIDGHSKAEEKHDDEPTDASPAVGQVEVNENRVPPSQELEVGESATATAATEIPSLQHEMPATRDPSGAGVDVGVTTGSNTEEKATVLCAQNGDKDGEANGPFKLDNPAPAPKLDDAKAFLKDELKASDKAVREYQPSLGTGCGDEELKAVKDEIRTFNETTRDADARSHDQMKGFNETIIRNKTSVGARDEAMTAVKDELGALSDATNYSQPRVLSGSEDIDKVKEEMRIPKESTSSMPASAVAGEHGIDGVKEEMRAPKEMTKGNTTGAGSRGGHDKVKEEMKALRDMTGGNQKKVGSKHVCDEDKAKTGNNLHAEVSDDALIVDDILIMDDIRAAKGLSLSGVTVRASLPGDEAAGPRRETMPGAYPSRAIPQHVIDLLSSRGRDAPNAPPEAPLESPPQALMQSALAGASVTEDTCASMDGMASVDSLAVASAVDDLPHAEAEDYDEEAAQRKIQEASERRRQYTKDWKRNMFSAIAFLAFLAVVLALTLSLIAKENSSDQQSSTSSPAINGVPATQAPTSHEGYLLSLLPRKTISAMEDPNSAQSRAFQWLLEDLEENSLQPEQQIKQRFALATIYMATGGDLWVDNLHWLSHSIHECQWFQKESFAFKHTMGRLYPGYLKEFFPPTEPPPPRCDSRGLYLGLWLDANHLVGSIPVELYMLTSLRTLSFAWNDLKGSISSHIGELTSLEGFFAYGLKDAGTIPTEIGLLPNMKGIGFYMSELEGPIPNELWLLTNLETIAMGASSHTGTLPSEVGLLSQLRWLHIIETLMTGSIPTETGLLTNLEWFVLEQNRLTGPLPEQIGQLTKSTLLSLWNNELSGTIPSEIGGMTSTTLLTLHWNQLTGTIPTQVGLLTDLTYLLDMGRNPALGGTLPTELGLLTNLQELSVADNKLIEGTIPSELGRLAMLEWLGLYNASLTGTIPQELSAMNESLYLLQLQGNAGLSGVVPSGLCTIHGQCTEHSLKRCEDARGLFFDCTNLLCGCDCPSCLAQTNTTIGGTIPFQ